MKQLLFDFMEDLPQPDPYRELHFITEPKDINEHLLNLQYQYLVHGNKAAWTKLWVLAQKCAESMLVAEQKKKGFPLSYDDKQDKALGAVEYVLRRYSTRNGWFVKKSFVSQIKGGVMHALYYRTKGDAIVDYYDWEETFENYYQAEDERIESI